MRKEKAEGSASLGSGMVSPWGCGNVRGSAGGERRVSAVPGGATSSMPANRDRLRVGTAVVPTSPTNLLAASCLCATGTAVGPGCSQGSSSNAGSVSTAGAVPGSVGADRGWRMLSSSRGGMSVSRSPVHGAEPSARVDGAEHGREVLGDGRPLHRASNCRRIWEER